MNNPVLNHVWTTTIAIPIGIVLAVQCQKKIPVTWMPSHATTIATANETPIGVCRLMASN